MANFVGTYSAITETTETFSALGRRMAVLTDPTSPDSVSIVSQPAVGRAIPRGDGFVDVDWLDQDPNGDQVVVYDRTKAGVTQRVTATVTVAPATAVNGWGLGDYYLPRIDHLTNAIVVEPSQNTRVIYVALDASGGLTAAEIAALESVSEGTITATWLKDNPATGQGGLYYGESEGLALVTSLAEDLFVLLQENTTNTASPWILWKRGDTFVVNDQLFTNATGYSALHPILCGSWGDPGDPLPLFDSAYGVTKTLNGSTRFVIWQDYRTPGGIFSVGGVSFTAFDNALHFHTSSYQTESSSASYQLKYNNTFRRFTILDAYKNTPGGTDWAIGGLQTDRHAGMFISENVNTLFQDMYADLAGWNVGYRMDGNGAFPMAPNEYSHCLYIQYGNVWQTFENIGTSRGAATGIQARSGGVFQNMAMMDSQVQLFISDGGIMADNSRRANYSYVGNYIGTVGGYKAFDPGTGLKSVGYARDGIRTASVNTGVDRALMVNDELSRLPVASTSTDIGPASFFTSTTYATSFLLQDSATWSFKDSQTANWDLEPDSGVTGIDSGVIDGTTAGAFYNSLAGGTGADHLDLITRWRGMANPWSEFEAFINWGRGRMGNDVTARSVATTCYFRPSVNQHTPGNRYDIRMDWAPWGIPGDVDGDSVDLEGHVITWNQTPKNSIDNFTFGVGGGLRVTGVLDVTGDLITSTGGHLVRVYYGGQFLTAGHVADDKITVDVTDGRFMNYGTVTGGFDIFARYRSEVLLGYDTASFTVASGDTLTVYGDSLVGFDGASGGSAALVIQGTLAFKPTLRLNVGDVPVPLDASCGAFPHIGATITNGSGGSGVCREWQYRGVAASPNAPDAMYVLDDFTGSFSALDTLTASDHHVRFIFNRGSGAVGTADSVGTPTMGKIAEFRSGMNGFTAPNVASSVTLASGSVVTVDTTGLDTGTYDLIDVDSLTDNGATLPSGVAVVGNKLVLTVS